VYLKNKDKDLLKELFPLWIIEKYSSLGENMTPITRNFLLSPPECSQRKKKIKIL
jgi:hypothetical protein